MKQAQIHSYRDGANRIEEALTGNNRQFFSDLRMYLLTANLFSDEGEVNQQLYELGSDLLEAERNGQSAEEYFGSDAQGMADKMIQHFNKSSMKERIKLSGLFIGIFWLFRFISDFTGKRPIELNILEYLLSAGFAVGMSFLLFKYLHYSVYAKPGFFKNGKQRDALVLSVGMIAVVAMFVLIQLFTPPIWVVTIP